MHAVVLVVEVSLVLFTYLQYDDRFQWPKLYRVSITFNVGEYPKLCVLFLPVNVSRRLLLQLSRNLLTAALNKGTIFFCTNPLSLFFGFHFHYTCIILRLSYCIMWPRVLYFTSFDGNFYFCSVCLSSFDC